MARKLPWTPSESTRNSTPQAKDVSYVGPKWTATRQGGGRPSTPETTPRKVRKRAMVRSPSTSPIRPPAEPISHIELMRPGFDADDRYMMVEDEFEATARQFTAHLHAAEYARLKRKARELSPRALPNLSPRMSRSTKRDLERKRLLSRQSTTLSGLGAHAGGMDGYGESDGGEEQTEGRRRGGGVVGSDDDDDDGVGRGRDLWSGTSLAGLMDKTIGAKTSLLGLDRLSSATRAAKGYGKGETENTPRKKQRMTTDTFGEGDQDLVGGQKSKMEEDLTKSRSFTTRSAPILKSVSTPTRTGAGYKSSRSIANNTRSRILNFDSFDDSDDNSDSNHNYKQQIRSPQREATSSKKATREAATGPAPSRTRSSLSTSNSTSRRRPDHDDVVKRRDRKGVRGTDSSRGGSRLDEVPVFLV